MSGFKLFVELMRLDVQERKLAEIVWKAAKRDSEDLLYHATMAADAEASEVDKRGKRIAALKAELEAYKSKAAAIPDGYVLCKAEPVCYWYPCDNPKGSVVQIEPLAGYKPLYAGEEP